MQIKLKDMLSERTLLYDGSKGFLLMQRGLAGGECADLWNITRKDDVRSIHEAYVGAGADVIQTNTLQGSGSHLEAWGLYGRLREINLEGVRLAKLAAGAKALVAASVGPTGRLMAPFGDMPFEEAAGCFSEQIRVLLEAGADILHFETFTDLSELRAAVVAAKRLSRDVPIIATISFEKNGMTMMGDSAGSAMATLASLGVDCAGANCGLAPGEMLSMFGKLAGFGVHLCSKPNAGQPDMVGGAPHYGVAIDEFYSTAFGFAEHGARLLGGCCGSGPAHIAKMREAVDAINANAGGRRGGASGASNSGAGGDKRYGGGATGASGTSGADGASDGGAEDFKRGQCLASAGRLVGVGAVALVAAAGGLRQPSADMSDLAACAGGSGGSGAGGAGDAEAEIIDRLLEAEDAEGDVAVLALLVAGDGSPWLGAGAQGAQAPGCGRDGGRYAKAAEIFRLAAVNARTYLKKPAVFCTDSAMALDAALSHYCGRAGVLLPPGAAKAGKEAGCGGNGNGSPGGSSDGNGAGGEPSDSCAGNGTSCDRLERGEPSDGPSEDMLRGELSGDPLRGVAREYGAFVL
ncbi:MAG: homocysteine S-methyltransferase family protein [Clostridiales bacterium]|jgi:5-methyltetrahydrofolate--homocysteine methyltransferase|nr:homocysteine S-methyltransferase family protein [Clostridiales bacterium]